MQKVLHQPEGAQPAADEAPQQASEHKEKAQGGEGYLKAPLIQQRLQGPDGAGGHGPGAGVAIQPRNADVFETAPINLPVEKSVHISVCHNGKQKLYGQSAFISHRSPNPDALQADHHRLLPDYGQLALSDPDAKEDSSGQNTPYPGVPATVLPEVHPNPIFPRSRRHRPTRPPPGQKRRWWGRRSRRTKAPGQWSRWPAGGYNSRRSAGPDSPQGSGPLPPARR